MTAVFEEGDLQITVNNAENAWRFDGPGHGLSHCMRAVDLIIEQAGRYVFVEFKDPFEPGSTEREQQRFLGRFQSGGLDNDLTYKYRDSYLYEWASGRANKPIHYAVLVAADELTEEFFLTRTEDLKRKLPVDVPSSWSRSFVQGCSVFNLPLWNRYFPDFPVTRVSLQS